MADDQPIGADDVARKHFATAFRGFDQYEVRAFLAQVAAELASLHERERALRERLTEAVERPVQRPVGEDELEAALGVETTRVLHAAREAAAEIRAKAEESVARLLREANDEAGRLRGEAETVLARRTEEAEAAASTILRSAEETAAALRADAEAAATAAVEEAQGRGREMVAEAQAVRERILKDLSRRRRAAATQLEQLLAGRERLLVAYDVVRENVEVATRELVVAEDEARLAADVAGFRAQREHDEDPPVVELAAEPEPDQEAEPEPEPDPEPEAELPAEEDPAIQVVPAPVPDETPAEEDRRSSSLRLLRRRAEEKALPALQEDVQGAAGVEADPAPSRPVAVPDLPEDEAEAAPEPEAETGAPEGEPSGAAPVEDLFARLRADRAKAVASAEAVLAESPVAVLEPEDRAEEAPEPEVGEEPAATAEDAAFEARDAAVEPSERALTRALKRALADEQNEVLDGMRRLKGRPGLDVLLPDADEHAARYARVADEHLRAATAAGAASLGGGAPAVDEVAAALGAEIAEDLRVRLGRAFDETGAGDDEQLIEAVSATYREWKTSRAEPLARHHVAAAYAFGTFDASTPGGELRWVVDAAEGGCPDCDDNALAGPTVKGEPFPTGQLHPPAHAGCRCVVLPAS